MFSFINEEKQVEEKTIGHWGNFRERSLVIGHWGEVE
jgi:hypothetical protein